MGKILRVVMVVVGLALLGAAAPETAAAAKAKAGGKAAAKGGAPAKVVNACGCYADSQGRCFCGKGKAKCACPGECEPKGCEEKRAKQMEKEIAAETKKAAEADKKQRGKPSAEKSEGKNDKSKSKR